MKTLNLLSTMIEVESENTIVTEVDFNHSIATVVSIEDTFGSVEISFFSFTKDEEDLDFVPTSSVSNLYSVLDFRHIMAEVKMHYIQWKQKNPDVAFFCKPTCEKRARIYSLFLEREGLNPVIEYLDDDIYLFL